MNEAQELLLSVQGRDGGWPPRQGGPSATETTALACLALGIDDAVATQARERALSWLRGSQWTDGSWPPGKAVTLSGWMTSVAVIALAGSRSDQQRALAGARWLLEQEGRGYSWLTKLAFRLFPDREVIELDPDLTGWSWYPNTFSWVEPTSYALIALKALRAVLPPEPTTARIKEGERMILDRSCAEGGWNYGNSRVYDEELWPYPDTTALALIALQDRTELPEVSRGLSALREMLDENPSVLSTALGLLCLRKLGQTSFGLPERLLEKLNEGMPWWDTRALAYAAIALGPWESFGAAHA